MKSLTHPMHQQHLPESCDEARADAIELWDSGHSEAAVHLLKDFLRTGREDAFIWNDLAVLSFSLSNFHEAAEGFTKALSFDANLPAALRGLAESLIRLHRYPEAIEPLGQYLAIESGSAGAQISLIQCLFESGSMDDALSLAESYLLSHRGSVRLHVLMAQIYQHKRLPSKTLKQLRQAAALDPKSLELRVRLTMAEWDFGRTSEAPGLWHTGTDWNRLPRNLALHLCWAALHDPHQNAAQLLDIHHRAAAIEHVIALSPPRDRQQRQLRIGYLAGEFAEGPAYQFLMSWLQHIPRAEVYSTFYDTKPRWTAKTSTFRALADDWRDVGHYGRKDLADLVRSDKIDILVDFSGHFEGNRLDVFQERPAPIQVTFPNYPGTTGLAEADYIFTDLWNTPYGTEDEYAETPYRLPSGYLVFLPPCDLPDVSEPPQLKNGFTTFGLLQRPGKYHPEFWVVASKILQAAPDSRLLIHFASDELDDRKSPQCEYLSQTLQSHGIDTRRVIFAGTRAPQDHLRLVSTIDIALDSFPYNGQTTTCDCLWMGVPVVTLRGSTHVSRVGAALLDRMELSHLAASSQDGYMQTALQLSSQPNRLRELRAGLREKAQRHLGDGARLAREISEAYRWMWLR